jgi:alpha-beta hydrolase superfamily lysophospholipase
MRFFYSALLMSLLACDKGQTAPPAPQGTGSTTPPAPQSDGAISTACAGGTVVKEVTFASSDGLVVHAASSNPCGGAPRSVVVLSHQMCKDRNEWSQPTHNWVAALGTRGIATLAIDLRGHGLSKAFPDGSTHDLCAEVDSAPTALFAGMPADVKAGVAYARGALAATQVAVIGASIGSNSAIVAYAADPKLTFLVALSPGLDYRGITTDAAIKSIGARPALLEAAKDDSASADSVNTLKVDNAAIQTQVWPTGGHANAMIDAHPEELPRVCDLVAAKL